MGLVVFALLSSTIASALELESTPTAEAEVVDIEADLPNLGDLGYWQWLREQYGLHTDAAMLLRLIQTKQGLATWMQYSIPLTKQEEQIVSERLNQEARLAALSQDLRSIDGYAGSFVSDSGGVVVAFSEVRSLPDLEARTTRLGSTNPVTFEPVEHSLDDLEDLSRRIRQDFPAVGTLIDTRTNSVSAIVSPDAPPRLSIELADQYGSDAEVRVEPLPVGTHCNKRYHCGGSSHDLRGGLSTASALGNCHTAFMVDNPAMNRVNLTTAGHCIDSTGFGTVVGSTTIAEHGGPRSYVSNVYTDGTTADAGEIQIPSGKASHHIWKRGSNRFVPVMDVNRGAHNLQSTRCTGARNFGAGFYCGIVDGYYSGPMSIDGVSTQVNHFVLLKIGLPGGSVGTPCTNVVGGASGAAVFTLMGNTAVRAEGILSACSGVATGSNSDPVQTYSVFFSRIAFVETELGVTVETG